MQISQHLLDRIESHAVGAFPGESCGFLTGRAGDDIILGAIPSPNLAGGRQEFLIDAALHLKLQRTLRQKGQAVIGIYHSHPSGDSEPSEKDRISLSGRNLVWMITGLSENHPPETRIFRLLRGKSGSKSQIFDEKRLQIARFVA
jgi:proteasome lid subunit RPN8/RPN11